jgi:hypothetical protein
MLPVDMIDLEDPFQIANYIEACLWIVVGLTFSVAAIGYSAGRPRRSVTAFIFILFGISDIVEAQTGAWYRPLGLLSWKGLCLAGIIWLVVLELRSRSRSRR